MAAPFRGGERCRCRRREGPSRMGNQTRIHGARDRPRALTPRVDRRIGSAAARFFWSSELAPICLADQLVAGDSVGHLHRRRLLGRHDCGLIDAALRLLANRAADRWPHPARRGRSDGSKRSSREGFACGRATTAWFCHCGAAAKACGFTATVCLKNVASPSPSPLSMAMVVSAKRRTRRGSVAPPAQTQTRRKIK